MAYLPGIIKYAMVGDEAASRRQVIETLVPQGYPYLAKYLATDLRTKERYWEKMFDALALGLTGFEEVSRQKALAGFRLMSRPVALSLVCMVSSAAHANGRGGSGSVKPRPKRSPPALGDRICQFALHGNPPLSCGYGIGTFADRGAGRDRFGIMDRRTIRCALCREGHLSAAWEVFRVSGTSPASCTRRRDAAQPHPTPEAGTIDGAAV